MGVTTPLKPHLVTRQKTGQFSLDVHTFSHKRKAWLRKYMQIWRKGKLCSYLANKKVLGKRTEEVFGQELRRRWLELLSLEWSTNHRRRNRAEVSYFLSILEKTRSNEFLFMHPLRGIGRGRWIPLPSLQSFCRHILDSDSLICKSQNWCHSIFCCHSIYWFNFDLILSI